MDLRERKYRVDRKKIHNKERYTVIPRFTSLIRSSKTAIKAKTRKTKINFPLLSDGNNDRFARGRSSYLRKLARKLINRN
jgi:hypothetical protein